MDDENRFEWFSTSSITLGRFKGLAILPAASKWIIRLTAKVYVSFQRICITQLNNCVSSAFQILTKTIEKLQIAVYLYYH